MLLDQPIDPNTLQNLSEAEKLRLLKQGYLELLQIIQSAQQQKYQSLSSTIKIVDQQRIQDVKQLIESM